MVFFVSGKILSILVFLLICKLFKNFSELILFEKVIGWFVIDYLFEEYLLTTGKFFLIDPEFRSLIKNLITIIFDAYFFVKQSTLLKFIFITTFVVCIFIFLIKKKYKYEIKLIVLLSYIYLLYTFLVVNVCSFICFLKILLFSWGLLVCMSLYFYLITLILTINCSWCNIKQILIILELKISFYIYFFVIKLFVFFIKISNFVLDEVFKLLIPYAYFYYIFKI